ncbi:Transposase [Oceanibacterium hippocampi]|uniref:Transposase n=1 Tax=Oceanibacterium hippocampi TaxID=745714 RepID=A0A1Y5TLL7_9PROT|nr:Transposase [Oceanibacterium hippocampi]
MKRSQFTEEQIIGILPEHEAGTQTADVCRRHAVSEATFYKWNSKYGGLEVSEAKRLKVLAADRSSARYRPRRPDDGEIRTRLRELSRLRRRFGYRRHHLLLAREGLVMNQKKPRRLYAEEQLQIRRRGGRKRALGTLAPMTKSSGSKLASGVGQVTGAFVCFSECLHPYAGAKFGRQTKMPASSMSLRAPVAIVALFQSPAPL